MNCNIAYLFTIEYFHLLPKNFWSNESCRLSRSKPHGKIILPLHSSSVTFSSVGHSSTPQCWQRMQANELQKSKLFPQTTMYRGQIAAKNASERYLIVVELHIYKSISILITYIIFIESLRQVGALSNKISGRLMPILTLLAMSDRVRNFSTFF